ncbi:hypothetical protein V3C99_014098 [Haemonchus contortus]
MKPPENGDALAEKKEEPKRDKAGSNRKDSNNEEGARSSSPKEQSDWGGIFDKTQWERTRFAKEAQDSKKSGEGVDEKGPEADENQPKESQLIGESRQIVSVKGQYLNEKPKFIITLLVFELIWSVVCIMVWSTAADNPMLPLFLAIVNMLVIFLLILACLSVEFFRIQVRREDSKWETRFFVPYSWRYSICEAHIARACLLCANITIMAFDNDFDTGSVIVLAATPIHLILVSIHIFIAVKPKRE